MFFMKCTYYSGEKISANLAFREMHLHLWGKGKPTGALSYNLASLSTASLPGGVP